MILLLPLVVLFGAWVAAAAALDRYGARGVPEGTFAALVVPGAAVLADGRPSAALVRRVDEAVRLWKLGKAPLLALTGGVGTHGRAEAIVARDHAIAAGVPESAIVYEDRSHSTSTNASFLAEKLGRGPVLVVTDSYHVWRCERVFRLQFDAVEGVGVWPPRPARARMALREALVTAVYAWRGSLAESDGPLDEALAITRMALPVVIGQLGFMAMGVVDVLVVGHLSEDALAAVALGHTWSFGTTILAMGASQGLDPLFAQAVGANDLPAAGRALRQGTLVVGVIGAFVGLLHLFAAQGLGLLGQPADLLPIAGTYCQILLLGLPFVLIGNVGRQFLQAHGRMTEGAIAMVLGNVVNLPLNLILVYGMFGVPALGVSGSAWATVVARVAMCAVILWFGRDRLLAAWASGKGAGLAAALTVARTCTSVAGQMALEVWAFTGTTLLVGAFGKTAVAAHMVALNLTSISFMVPLGISMAAATRVGNHIGAGRKWGTAAIVAVAGGASCMSLSALLYASFPGLLVGAYTNQPDVVALAVTMLPIAAVFQLFDGTQVVAFGVLRGAGDTRVPALANIVGYYVIGLPLGWYLAHEAGFGPRGLWFGLVAGLATVAFLLLVRLRSTIAKGGYRVSA